MPDDLAAKRSVPSASRRPASQPHARSLFFKPTHVRRREPDRHNSLVLPTGERREKAQTSAIAITLAITTLVLGGIIALIVELT